MKKARRDVPKKAVASASLSRKHHWFLIFLPIIMFGGFAVVLHFMAVTAQKSSVAKTVRGWQAVFHFTDEQAEIIRQIEIDFHGNGSPYSFRVIRTAEEKKAHHKDIATQMTAEEGARFLQTMDKRH